MEFLLIAIAAAIAYFVAAGAAIRRLPAEVYRRYSEMLWYLATAGLFFAMFIIAACKVSNP